MPSTNLRSVLPKDAESAPDFVDHLIHQAEEAAASDIHIQVIGKEAEICFRLDGVMTSIGQVSEPLAERVVGRIKYLSKLKTYQESLPQDGRIAKQDIMAKNDIRVSTYPTVTGEKLVLRLFRPESAKSIDELNFSSSIVVHLDSFLRKRNGLLLLTGPVGSGKTTTIYSCLRHLAAQKGRHIITIEDPVEQIIPGVMQTEINEARGLDFAKSAKHLLRQDPEVLVVGEIRDEETVNVTIRAAMTGHLVISTLHAGSCKGVLDRLLLMCRDHFAVFSALDMVLNQRLVRRVCAPCHGAGCTRCLHTGYKGRIPIVEMMRWGEAEKQHARLNPASPLSPTVTFAESSRDLLANGLSNQQEIDRVSAYEVG